MLIAAIILGSLAAIGAITAIIFNFTKNKPSKTNNNNNQKDNNNDNKKKDASTQTMEQTIQVPEQATIINAMKDAFEKMGFSQDNNNTQANTIPDETIIDKPVIINQPPFDYSSIDNAVQDGIANGLNTITKSVAEHMNGVDAYMKDLSKQINSQENNAEIMEEINNIKEANSNIEEKINEKNNEIQDLINKIDQQHKKDIEEIIKQNNDNINIDNKIANMENNFNNKIDELKQNNEENFNRLKEENENNFKKFNKENKIKFAEINNKVDNTLASLLPLQTQKEQQENILQNAIKRAKTNIKWNFKDITPYLISIKDHINNVEQDKEEIFNNFKTTIENIANSQGPQDLQLKELLNEPVVKLDSILRCVENEEQKKEEPKEDEEIELGLKNSSDIQNSEDAEQVIIKGEDADNKTKKDVIIDLFNTLINNEDYKEIEQNLKETLALLSFKQNKQTNNFEFNRKNTEILTTLCENEKFKKTSQKLDKENNFIYFFTEMHSFNDKKYKILPNSKEEEYNNNIDYLVDEGIKLKDKLDYDIHLVLEKEMKKYKMLNEYLSNPNDDKFKKLNDLLKSIKDDKEEEYNNIETNEDDELCNMLFYKENNEDCIDFEIAKQDPIIAELVNAYVEKEKLDKIQAQINNQQPAK